MKGGFMKSIIWGILWVAAIAGAFKFFPTLPNYSAGMQLLAIFAIVAVVVVITINLAASTTDSSEEKR